MTVRTSPRTTARPIVHALGATAAATALLLAVQALPASAHEKWFLTDPDAYHGDWSFTAQPAVLAGIATVVVATLLWRLVAVKVLPTPELGLLRPLGRLAPYVPRLLAIHLGVSLLAAAVGGHFLTHDLDMAHLSVGPGLLLVEGGLGVWFVTGIRVRPAAAALALIGPAALLVTGPVGLLSSADLLGIAGFLAVMPPSNDTFGRVTPDPATVRQAVLALRLGVATALVTLAFAEKLANPAMARATLAAYPRLDVFALVGLHLPADMFIGIAGCTELLFGALVASGAMPQLAVLMAGIPFNATLLLFGGTEMLGHLPVYGAFLTLLVLGSNPATAAQVRWIPRPRAGLVKDLLGARAGGPATARP